jgi:hypothetical protein
MDLKTAIKTLLTVLSIQSYLIRILEFYDLLPTPIQRKVLK